MGSVGAEHRRPTPVQTPVQTPEEKTTWRDGGREGWRDAGRESWRESGVVQSYSFDSYQLEEEEISKDAPERGVLALSETDFEEPIPEDRYHGIYFAMLLAGVGFLLPYNSFITDVDYLHHKFEGTSIVFDMSLTYILVALLAVILNNVLVERLSLHTRITVGYILALGPLVFVSVFDVWLAKFTTQQAYIINLVSVGVVAFGCTVQQSSFYGYMGMLPKRYTQGVMTGESTAGVIISLSRIFTKLLIHDERRNTLIFFLVSICMEMLCFLLHLLVRRSRFVRYYTNHAQGKGRGKGHDPRDNGTGYRVHHDVTAEDVRFILAALPYDWSGGRLLFFSCLRVVFIPLFVMCVYPASSPTLSHPAWPCLFSLLMGVTNGYFGSVPMIQAAGKVPPEQRELAGNTMTVSYMTGLMVGSAVAYVAYSFTSPGSGTHLHTLNMYTPANATGY
ncbi:equilibrative nucleoside transporter 4 [Halichoeres trimaculatus]|uniref:equilibrative nucleoside transporter 4 n=1 Tax=Halichoeres trimaculatus TaxID=147232 RepID=UPI003D9F20EB